MVSGTVSPVINPIKKRAQFVEYQVTTWPTGFSDLSTALQRNTGIPVYWLQTKVFNEVYFNQNCAYYDGVGIN